MIELRAALSSITFESKKILPLRFGVMFYGISQSGTRHTECVLFEETRQSLPVAFADFAQHPSDGFVYQIVRMRKEFLG